MAKKSKSAAKAKSTWECSSCEQSTQGWFGRCPHCGDWNTIEEKSAAPESQDRVVLSSNAGPAAVVAASEAVKHAQDLTRLTTGIAEFDRVLGGGLVPGSLTLVGGPPGIGKSTLLLQACADLARGHGPVLYASGEESVAQVGGRAARLGADVPKLLLTAETRVGEILAAASQAKPVALVVDSVQTVYCDDQDGIPGNVGQIRSVTAKLLSWAKSRAIPVILVGHVTKDGQLAGPRLLEHMVDTVLAFEGDEERAIRILRSTKNRFGSTQELGVFEMTGEGLAPIENPSEAFLGETKAPAIGACVTATLEGSRPLLLEIQALMSTGAGGNPRRTSVGTDNQRLAMLLAVMQRHTGIFTGDQDVFVNVTGGLRLHEPAVDLAVLLALASSFRRKALPQGTIAVGEVGLTGELRRVPRLAERLTEAERLGFTRAVVPASALKSRPATLKSLELMSYPHVSQAIEDLF